MVGATGRMGALAQRLIAEADDLELHAAIGSADDIAGSRRRHRLRRDRAGGLPGHRERRARPRHPGSRRHLGLDRRAHHHAAAPRGRRRAARRRDRAELLARLGPGDRVRRARRPVVRVHRDRGEPPRGQGRLALRHGDPHRRADRARAHRRRTGRGSARRSARAGTAGRERADPQPAASGALGPPGGRLRRRRRDHPGDARHPRRLVLRGGDPARASRGARHARSRRRARQAARPRAARAGIRQPA